MTVFLLKKVSIDRYLSYFCQKNITSSITERCALYNFIHGGEIRKNTIRITTKVTKSKLFSIINDMADMKPDVSPWWFNQI